MAKTKKSEDVPKAMKEKFDRVVAITDAFSKQLLNDERLAENPLPPPA